MSEEDPNPSLPRVRQDTLQPYDGGPFVPRDPQDDEPFDAWDEGLGVFDVFSLIVNKMIGTGIYTSPTAVFLLTGNKSLTLGLTAIYLQFAKVFPYNGGELIYLDEVTSHVKSDLTDASDLSSTHEENGESNDSELTQTDGTVPSRGRDKGVSNSLHRLVQLRRKLMGDGLLAYIIYSLMFIVFFNSATNSLQFGRMILMCINAQKAGHGTVMNGRNITAVNGDNKAATEVDLDVNQDVMRFIGVTIISIICFTQFFSPSWGSKLNKFLAVVKIGFLIGLIIVAFTALPKDIEDIEGNVVPKGQDWLAWHGSPSWVQFAKALLAVLFSFEGWENATFVAGGIPRRKHKVLRHNRNHPPILSGNNLTSRRAWPVIIAISAFGSLNAIVYTFSRVKQVIGQAEVLPWSRYLKQDDCIRRTERTRENDFHYRSPQGGLIAHWLFTVLMIAISASIKSTLESVGLPGYIQTYTHCFVLMVLGIGSFNLRSRQKALSGFGVPAQSAETGSFFGAVVLVSIPIFILLNILILVIVAIPPYKSSDLSGDAFPGWGFPTIVASVLVVGTVYYLLFFGAARRHYEALATNDDSEEEVSGSRAYSGILSPNSRWNLMQYGGVECRIMKDYSYKELERVCRFGRRWEIVYAIKGVDEDVSL
ncbi:high-affinity methionine permease [Fusarium sp. NRRL 25303]|nr:high-affinity methionine permease [Fusarium sp. NRRL 25303]